MGTATTREHTQGTVYVQDTFVQSILKFLDTRRILPTLQFFNALWMVCFHIKVWKETEALHYVQSTYFGKPVSLENVRKSFKGVNSGSRGRSSIWVEHHWIGI